MQGGGSRWRLVRWRRSRPARAATRSPLRGRCGGGRFSRPGSAPGARSILEVLADGNGEPVGPSELARRLGLPKSSIANICGALADAGLVRRIATGFALGRRLAELGGAYLASVDQVQEFYEASRSLPAGSEETVQFAVLDGLEVTYLARHDGRQPVRLSSGIGRRLPAFRRRPARPPWPHSTTTSSARRLAGVTTLPRATPQGARDGRRADRRHRSRSGAAAMPSMTSRPWKASSAMGSWSRAASRAKGPCAASITLLKVRATAERVPALIADLQRLGGGAIRPDRGASSTRRRTCRP